MRDEEAPITVPPMVGKAVNVFLAACEQVGADSRLRDFRWLKSKRQMERSHDDVVHTIWFQTSHYNESGKRAQMWVGINVRSKGLKKWRQENDRPIPQNDWIAGCNLSYLTPDPSGIKQWNVWGDDFVPAVREVRGLLADFALPFFDAFGADPSTMLALPKHHINSASATNHAAMFERLVQQGRSDLVPAAFERCSPEVQQLLRFGYDKASAAAANPEAVRPNRHAAVIYELGLGSLLGWS